jgi:LacI family transcriptional regulator
MAIRMKDIAAELGLSVVTISKVLRDHPDISNETRERVLKRVKELNYSPNATARSLVTGRSYLVGLVVPDLLHPFFAEIAVAISKTIRKSGYSLIIASCEEDAALEEQEIEQMVARRLDGLIIAACAASVAPLERLDEQNEPFVLIDRQIVGSGANFVGMDDRAAGRLATGHLLEMGCRRIAHIRGRENSTGEDRMWGYAEALEAAGLPVLDSYVIMRDKVDIDSRQQGAEAARRLLELHPRPDGIFCYNDPMALGAMQTILEAGLRIPEDIAVVGCGNLHYDDFFKVPLSSIDQQSNVVGERAGSLILSLIEAKDSRPRARTIVLEPRLIVRASSARRAARPASDLEPVLPGSR